MRLVKHDIRRERGKYRLFTSWKSQDRQPRTCEVTISHGEDWQPTEMVAFDDKGHLHHWIAGIAEIAWGLGWRPRGLSNTVAQVVANYKEPAEK